MSPETDTAMKPRQERKLRLSKWRRLPAGNAIRIHRAFSDSERKTLIGWLLATCVLMVPMSLPGSPDYGWVVNLVIATVGFGRAFYWMRAIQDAFVSANGDMGVYVSPAVVGARTMEWADISAITVREFHRSQRYRGEVAYAAVSFLLRSGGLVKTTVHQDTLTSQESLRDLLSLARSEGVRVTEA